MSVPAERIRAVNAAPVRGEREWVVYWMIAARRTRWSWALQRAVELARELRRPLLVLEALRCDYPYASDRLHAFVLAGMADNARRLAGRPAAYWPYVERAKGEGKGLLAALGARACAVVTDDWPAFFLPRAVAAAGAALDVRLEAVDGATVYPFRLAGREFPTAYLLRRHLQKALPPWLALRPDEDPLRGARLPRLEALPEDLVRRWPAATPAELADPAGLAASLPIDHAVPPAGRGGGEAAEARLRAFLDGGLDRYHEDRDEPDVEGGSSGLSPWLHFGHLSAHEVAWAVLEREGWSPLRLGPKADGAKAGWWGASPAAEAFLDQLITWRELGFGWAAFREDNLALSSLPRWAQETLARHASDARRPAYDLEALRAARTHDPLWNAAQRQLLREGLIHNTLRMLWGKKILEWSPSPAAALAALLELNDRYALDGRDPNSYTGILWCLGRHDRPWAPERPVSGTVRYMSSENQARKHAVKGYLARYAEAAAPRPPAQGSLFGEAPLPPAARRGTRRTR